MPILTVIIIAVLILGMTPSAAQMAPLPQWVRILLNIVKAAAIALLVVAAAAIVLGLLLFGLCLAASYK